MFYGDLIPFVDIQTQTAVVRSNPIRARIYYAMNAESKTLPL